MTVSSILSLPPLPTWPLKLKVIPTKCKYVSIYFLVLFSSTSLCDQSDQSDEKIYSSRIVNFTANKPEDN